jgi:hypothetical protein
MRRPLRHRANGREVASFRKSSSSSRKSGRPGSCSSSIWFLPGSATKRAPRDRGGELPSLLGGNDEVVANMHDQSARLHLGQEVLDIKVRYRLQVTRRAFRRPAHALQLVERVHLFLGRRRHQRRREELAERRIVGALIVPDERLQRRKALAARRAGVPLFAPFGKTAVEDQMRDPLRMPPRGVGDRDRTALRKSDERKAA